MKVKIKEKRSGKIKTVDKRYAEILVKARYATYYDADNNAYETKVIKPSKKVAEAKEEIQEVPKEEVQEDVKEEVIQEPAVVEQVEVEKPENIVDEVEISPVTGKPKRQYTRRDMKAED